VEGHRNGMVLSITGELDLLTAAQSAIMVFLKDTIPDNSQAIPFTHPSTDTHPWVSQIREEQLVAAPITDEGIAFPETVNFVGKGGKLFEVWEPIDGAASVVAKFLEDTYLHDMITIQNGAADVHCHVDYRSGTLKFISYRDVPLKSDIHFKIFTTRGLDDHPSFCIARAMYRKHHMHWKMTSFRITR
jgi:Zn-dependent M16 (insulinase) family peptidase